MTTNPFEATASALGYAFQFRYSLARALDLRLGGVDWSIAIEAGDDVEKLGIGGRELHQLKQRAPGTSLTDASVDLWKTLRVWCQALESGTLDLSTTRLLLVTTATVAEGSAPDLLRSNSGRDEATALVLLKNVAATSVNKTNAKAYKAFAALGDPQLRLLLRQVEVVDNTVDITALRERLRSVAVQAVRRSQTEAFLERLEGWWFEKCLKTLSAPNAFIEGVEFDAFYNRLRDGFHPDRLRVDPDVAGMHVESNGFDERIFVRQLGFTKVSPERIRYAVRDYVRASTQRSQWIRHQVLLIGDLAHYERRLCEEWELRFERMRDDLGETSGEADRLAAGKQMLRWAEDVSTLPIRDGCNEPFLTRGTYHHLADEAAVGWHPDFRELLSSLALKTNIE